MRQPFRSWQGAAPQSWSIEPGNVLQQNCPRHQGTKTRSNWRLRPDSSALVPHLTGEIGGAAGERTAVLFSDVLSNLSGPVEELCFGVAGRISDHRLEVIL